MRWLSCLVLFFFFFKTQAQSAADLSYPEIDSLLAVYEAQPTQYAEAGVRLALEASRLSGQEDSLCGEYLDWATVFYEAQGDQANTIRCYKKALEIFAQTNGPRSVRYARTLSFFGRYYTHVGNYSQALVLLNEVVDIQAAVLGHAHPDFATSINNLAALHWKLGHYDQALPLYIQAKDIYQRAFGENHAYVASSLNNLAALHRKLGHYDQALPLYIQAKNIKEKILGKDHPSFANSLNSLALLYKKMGNYSKALPLYIQAKNIREKTLGPEHPSFAASLHNLAFLYEDMGNRAKALPLYIQAKNIQEKVLGKAHPDFANSVDGLATLYENMGHFDQALPLYIQAKNIREKTLGQEHPAFAASLANLALLYYNMGDYDQALPLLRRAQLIQANALGQEHPAVANTRNNLAILYRDMKRYPEAWATAGLALASSTTQALDSTVPATWAETILKTSFSSNDHLKQAIATLEVVYALLEQDPAVEQASAKQLVVTELSTALLTKFRNSVSSDKDKLRLLHQSSQWLQRSLGLLHAADQGEQAFALADQNKSVLLFQASKSEAAYRLGNLPDSLIWQDKKLLQQQSQLQAQLLEQRSSTEKDQLRDALNGVNQEMEELVAHIKTHYPKYHQLKYQQPTVDVAAVQALLDEETALLEYVIHDSAMHIFYIDQQSLVWKKQPVLQKDLKKRIQKLHQVLSRPNQINAAPEKSYQTYTDQAHWFYTQLLAPVLEGRSGIKNLVIVTDGELGHLPFETFLVEQPPQALTPYRQLHYLVADYNISYNYSAALWQENKLAPAPANNGQLFGLAANYSFQLDSTLSAIRLPTDQWTRAALSPLPGARQEVEVLKDRYRGFFAFDSLASERMVKQTASDFAILHFATHGLLDERRPMLSSLALSEDSDNVESNFWQAHEISKMTLHANLVVLSACETGYGKFEQGNGIASLARAFMYAGAPSMVVSLWQVNDHATAQIMEHFYAHLADGMPIDQALRQAKLQYLETAVGPAAHPAFWSPFIHLGKTEAVVLQTKGLGLWSWSLGVVGFLLLGGGWWTLRRRQARVG